MAPTGITRVEQDAAFLKRQRLTVRCAFCKWYLRGKAPFVMEAQRMHALEKHGIDTQSVRRKPTRSLTSATHNNLTKAQWAEINAERKRRAREIGIDIEDAV